MILITGVVVLLMAGASSLSARDGYCEVGGGCDEYISRITIDIIDNFSTCPSSGGYSDFTDLEAALGRGTIVLLRVELGNAYSQDRIGVWIDWGRDFEFDPSDQIAIDTGVGPFYIQFPVPPDVDTGLTRLRVRLCFNQTPQPCGITEFGELEDYSILIEHYPNDCGEVNGDGAINVADVVFIINAVFKSGPLPSPPCRGDANSDSAFDLGDAVFLVNYIFKSGSPPMATCCAINK